jgi:nitrate/TMAO reductase-like tetraheme cytochrome c subunit
MTLITRLYFALLLVAGTALAADDPHWNKNSCPACHVDAAPVAGNVNLKESDAEALCDTCHGSRGNARPCRHASSIPEGAVTVAEALRPSMKEDQVVCTTCHDITYQCQHPTLQYSFHNPGFLRNRTSRGTGDHCFQCHEQSGYAKMNPHEGAAGTPPHPTCELCHSSVPETSDTGALVVEFSMPGDLNEQCTGCHVTRPHPKSMSFGKSAANEEWVHLVQPSAEVLENMRASQAETGIELPLNPLNGEVFCATCHNPHDFKIGGEHGSQESEMKHGLRLNDICQACHDK